MTLSDMLQGQGPAGQMPPLDPLSLMQLKAIRGGLKNGLDPDFGFGAYQSIMSPYMQAMQQPAALDPSGALGMLSDLASTNPNPAAAEAMSGALSSIGYDPTQLQGITSSLYAQPDQPSSLYQPPSSGGASLDQEDILLLQQQIRTAKAAGRSMDETLQAAMANVQLLGPVDEQTAQAVYTLVSQEYAVV